MVWTLKNIRKVAVVTAPSLYWATYKDPGCCYRDESPVYEGPGGIYFVGSWKTPSDPNGGGERLSFVCQFHPETNTIEDINTGIISVLLGKRFVAKQFAKGGLLYASMNALRCRIPRPIPDYSDTNILCAGKKNKKRLIEIT